MNKKQIRLTESDFLHKIENPNVRELVKAVLSERIFNEHLIKYQWTSGEATDVSPIMVWANQIDFQLDDPTLRNKYEHAIKNICNKYKNFFKNGYISNYDGSCPIYVRFLYADGVLDWIKDGKEIKENKQYNNMNKKLIKLTESDLHRIVKESVKKILAEADPRSWDAVARRYDQTDPQKAAYARQRGVQQWNKQFGGDVRMNNDGSLEDVGEIHPVPFRDSEVNAPFSMSRFQSNVVSNEPKYSGLGRTKYTPNMNGTFDLEHNDYTRLSKNGMEREFDGTRAANENPTKVNNQQGVPLGNYSRRFNVASQMKTGNGVYDKTRGGWQ